VDSVTPKQRSEIMARVRSKNTRPELRVRKLVFALGYRYRLHDRKLRAVPISFFGSREKLFLCMAASGIGTRDARSHGCQNLAGLFGYPNLKETNCATNETRER